jgi:hypothetical protein
LEHFEHVRFGSTEGITGNAGCAEECHRIVVSSDYAFADFSRKEFFHLE